MSRKVVVILIICIVYVSGNNKKSKTSKDVGDDKATGDSKRFDYVYKSYMSEETVRNKLGFEPTQKYSKVKDEFYLKAKFKINGRRRNRRVIKSGYVLYNGDRNMKWYKSESLQFVTHYLDGTSPVQVINIDENGRLSYQYIGSVMDGRCEKLDCQYQNVQPVGAMFKFQVMDPFGWALLNIITSPSLGREKGLWIVDDNELMCHL